MHRIRAESERINGMGMVLDGDGDAENMGCGKVAQHGNGKKAAGVPALFIVQAISTIAAHS